MGCKHGIDGFCTACTTEQERADLWTRCRDLDAKLTTQQAATAELRAEVIHLRTIEAAARNLVKVKGRFHTEQAFKALAALLVNHSISGGTSAASGS